MATQVSIPHSQRRKTYTEEILRAKSELTVAKLADLASFYSERTPFFSLHTVIRFCERHPAYVLGRYGSRVGQVEVSFSESEPDVAVAELCLRGDSKCVVAIQPGVASQTWLISTDAKPSSPEVARGLDPLLDRLGPLLIGGWVSTKQLVTLLQDAEKSTACRVRPSRVASRARGRSTVDWLGASSLNSVVAELSQRKAYLQSLAFRLVEPRASREVLKASMNRWYRVSYRSGSYYALRRDLIDPLSVLLAEQTGGVECSIPQGAAQEEVRFLFDGQQLGDRESHERLLDTIARLPRLGVSAFHLNPYLQLTVLDYENGSTMDLFSNDPAQVVFLPGPRCSGASILRVSNQIYSEFASGKLERVRATREDSGMGFGAD